ncbi:MAG TPA: NAD(P)-dependent oxidoreductase [Solirubrobacteraceae bacterium]|nr:NAD(P)-dependent oxidoreductase [Solirubrobacteraceae bacterium]
MTRVLVSGARGFVGLPLLAELARDGAELHALSTRPSPPALPGVCWHQLDLFDSVAVDALMQELAPERLVHLAWYTKHGHYWRAPENVTWVERSLELLRAFSRHGGRRLVMLGTCAEYDWSTAGAPLVESSSPLVPATLYGVAKDALRRVADAYAAQEGVELAWGRLFFLYGPREASERLVPSVTRALLLGEPVAVSSAQQVRDFMHVDDVAGAVAALLESNVVGPVNIASGVGVTVGDVIEGIVRLIGRPDLVRRGALPDRLGDPPLLLADVTRLRDEVGFRPRWELADGLAATVQWWRRHVDDSPYR